MKSCYIRGFAVSAAALAGLLAWAAPAHAQVPSAPVVSGVPMVVKQTPAKKIWLKATVIHADANSIMVQDEANSLMVHTFNYAPALRDKMQRISDAGGYQYGDKVFILYHAGDTTALDVRGRPSKPS